MITLEVNGTRFENFTNAEVQIRLDTLAHQFNFSAITPQGAALPFNGGDECKVYADGQLVLTGYVERINVSYTATEHNINLSGRNLTADLVDSTLSPISDIRADNLTLKALCEKVIEQLGLPIQVIDLAQPEPFNLAQDLISPEPAENAFTFLQKYAKKKQVLLTSDEQGNLVLTRNSLTNVAGALQNRLNDNTNNILSSNFTYDISNRFNRYEIRTAKNPLTLNDAGETSIESISNVSNFTNDSEIRASRRLVIDSDTELTAPEALKRAKWEADVRRSRGLTYSATVKGFRVGYNTGELWQTNRLYQITDDFVGKIEPMLCNALLFAYDTEGGSTTELELVGATAYTDFEEPERTNEVASNVV